MNSSHKDVLIFEFDAEVTELLGQLSLVDDKSTDLEESSSIVKNEEKASENSVKSIKSIHNISISPMILSKTNSVISNEHKETDINTASNSALYLRNLESKCNTAITLNDEISASLSELTSSNKEILDITKSENEICNFKKYNQEEIINLNKDNDANICKEVIQLIERGRIKNDKHQNSKHRFQEYPHPSRLKWDSPEITSQELLSLFAREEIEDNIDISLFSNQNVNPVYGTIEESGSSSTDVDVDSGYCTSPVSSSLDPFSPNLQDIAEEDSFVERDCDKSSTFVNITSLHLPLNKENSLDDSVSDELDKQLPTKPQVRCENADESINKLSSKRDNVYEHNYLKNQLQSPDFEAITPYAPLKSELRKLGYNLETSAKYKLFYSNEFSRERCRLEYYKIYKDIKKGLLGTEDTKVIHYLEEPKNSNYRGTNLHSAVQLHNVEKVYCYIEIHKQYHKSLFEINLRDSKLETVLDLAVAMKMDPVIIDYLKENMAVQSEQCKVNKTLKSVCRRHNFKEVDQRNSVQNSQADIINNNSSMC